MSTAEVCPANRHDRPEERVICLLERSVPGAWTFICPDCWEAMLNAKARREEWEVEE
jgi:hypothetical protein